MRNKRRYCCLLRPIGGPSQARECTKWVANHPIHVVILTSFAVDVRFQGMGLGRAMLRDLLIRVSLVAVEEIGIRALLIHAKDGKPWLTTLGRLNLNSRRLTRCIFFCS